MRQRSRKEDTTATKTCWAIRRVSRSHAKPGAGGRSGVFLFLKKNKGKKMKIAIILLLWMAEAASSPQNSLVVSGAADHPCQQCVFFWDRERNGRGWSGVGEVIHLSLVLNSCPAPDFLCVCKSKSSRGTRHL